MSERNVIVVVTVFVIFAIWSISSYAKDGDKPDKSKKYYPVIDSKITQKAEAGRNVPVLIKLKEQWEHPSVRKMTTAKDPSHFISKNDIKKLQDIVESSFTEDERKKDIKITHKLKNTPWIGAKINLKALNKLKANPNVAYIILS